MAWDQRPRDPYQQRGFEMIGAMIKRRRLMLGWTQRDLEARSGIDQTVISRLENGKQYGLRWSRFAELVGALGGLDAAPAGSAWPPPATELPDDPEDAPGPSASKLIDLALGLQDD